MKDLLTDKKKNEGKGAVMLKARETFEDSFEKFLRRQKKANCDV